MRSKYEKNGCSGLLTSIYWIIFSYYRSWLPHPVPWPNMPRFPRCQVLIIIIISIVVVWLNFYHYFCQPTIVNILGDVLFSLPRAVKRREGRNFWASPPVQMTHQVQPLTRRQQKRLIYYFPCRIYQHLY